MDYMDNLEVRKTPIDENDYIVVNRDSYPKCYKIKLADLKKWIIAQNNIHEDIYL